jgi:hypothetical protein
MYEERVYEEARDRGIEEATLGMYFSLRRGMARLAASIEAARRPSKGQRPVLR